MAPKGATVWVDGQQGDSAAMGRPAVVQVVSAAGVDTYLVADGGAPDDLARTSRRDVAKADGDASGPVIALGAAGTLVSAEGNAQAYGGPQARVHVPLAGALHVEALLGLPLTYGYAPSATSDNGVLGLPMAQLAVAARGSDGVAPWGSAGVLLLSDDDGMLFGGAGAVGVDLPLGPIALAPELRGGGAGVPLVGIGLGVALGM